MHAHWIKVLDRADDHHVVVAVSHEFEFVFLPPEDRFLEQHFGGGACLQSCAGNAAEVVGVVGEAGACATHRERRTDDHRVSEILNGSEDVVE